MLFKSASNLSWDAITADRRDKATVQAPSLPHAHSGLIASTLYLRLIEVHCLKSLVLIHQSAGQIKQLTGKGAETRESRGWAGRREALREMPADARKRSACPGRGGSKGAARARAALSLPRPGRFPRRETLARTRWRPGRAAQGTTRVAGAPMASPATSGVPGTRQAADVLTASSPPAQAGQSLSLAEPSPDPSPTLDARGSCHRSKRDGAGSRSATSFLGFECSRQQQSK